MLRFAVVPPAFSSPTQAEVNRERLQYEALWFNGIIIFRREHNSGVSSASGLFN